MGLVPAGGKASRLYPLPCSKELYPIGFRSTDTGLLMVPPFGVPFTLDQAYPFVQDAIVALGFPDIIFQPEDAYRKLFFKQAETNADIVLGLFPAHQPQKTDMVELDDDGRICALHIKPEQTQLRYTWQIAVWTPVFTSYVHDYVYHRKENAANLKYQKELFVEMSFTPQSRTIYTLNSYFFRRAAI